MKSLNEIQQTLREQKPYLAEKYSVKIVGVFGSYVRQEQELDSDLDLLIELDRPPKISLIGLVELEDHCQATLSRRTFVCRAAIHSGGLTISESCWK